MFEHRSRPLLSAVRFAARQLRLLVVAAVMDVLSLAMCVAGYMGLAGMDLVDALYQASMILGGMGPVGTFTSDAAGLFASADALNRGIALLGSVAVILAPLVNRMLHAHHLMEHEKV